MPEPEKKKWKWYTVSLYINTLLEGTFLVQAYSGRDARCYVLSQSQRMSEYLGKTRIDAESMRVKDKHLSSMDRHGFIA